MQRPRGRTVPGMVEGQQPRPLRLEQSERGGEREEGRAGRGRVVQGLVGQGRWDPGGL